MRYAVAYDVGRAVNPMLVEGQIVGGLTQGIGGALLEELAYGDDGQLRGRLLHGLPAADRGRGRRRATCWSPRTRPRR